MCFLTNLQVEWSDVELSGAAVRLKVLPKHLPEHREHLCGTGGGSQTEQCMLLGS